MKDKLTIGFDFDETLHDYKHDDILRKMLMTLAAGGANIYIVTARCNHWEARNKDLEKVCSELNISQDRVIYTCLTDKFQFMQKYQIDLLIDNNFSEIHDIHIKGGCGLLVNFNINEVLSLK